MEPTADRLYAEMIKIPIIDTHSHIDPHRPTARDLDDLLGRHYYTRLAHAAGMEHAPLRSEVPAEERARIIAGFLPSIENTVQYSWLLEIARTLFDFPHERLDASNIDDLWKRACGSLEREYWETDLRHRSNVEKIFVMSDFDVPLEELDTSFYVPCLLADDLVLRLGQPSVIERLRYASGRDAGNASSLRQAIEAVFERFAAQGARACAVSLPPTFSPEPVSLEEADPPIRRLLSGLDLPPAEELKAGYFVLWTLAQLCREHKIPLQIEIGVQRNAYPGGVHHGRDVVGRDGSLHQLRMLFQSFPEVVFPVSVLTVESNQELAVFSAVFPNVVAHGHGGITGLPAYIEGDARARLQGLPRTKQIGYYSDAPKLELVLPKFNMYRRVLAKVLAEEFVVGRGWREEKALDLAHDMLRGNVERVFFHSEAVRA